MYSLQNKLKILAHISTILECIDIATNYFQGINTPDDFLLSQDGIMRLDACTMRKVILELQKKYQ